MLDHTGHAVLLQEASGEEESAAQGGGAVCVKSFALVHGEVVRGGGGASEQPADVRGGPAADSRARHRLVVSPVDGLGPDQRMNVRPGCERTR